MAHHEIVLALGGGGARGLAHIGIIQAIEAAGYRIRGVAGTSIGSVIGGMYCAGKLHEYEAFIRGLDKKGILRLLDPRFPVRGLLGGRKIESLLRKMTERKQFHELEVPFISVATELREGTEVRLTEGDVALAIRASYAIPGFFTPVLIAGQWLVDGGVSTPVPVAAARELAALPVVAVNVNSSGQPPIEAAFEALVSSPVDSTARAEPKILEALSDSIAHLQFNLARYQLQVLNPAFTLEPQLRGIGLFDFHQGSKLIEAGRETAQFAIASGEFELAVQAASLSAQAPTAGPQP